MARFFEIEEDRKDIEPQLTTEASIVEESITQEAPDLTETAIEEIRHPEKEAEDEAEQTKVAEVEEEDEIVERTESTAERDPLIVRDFWLAISKEDPAFKIKEEPRETVREELIE